MQALQEVTVWPGNTPNHIYFIEGYDRLVAYIPEGSTTPVKLKKWMRFNRRGRDFKLLNMKLPNKNTRLVQGSRGSVYEVNDEEGTCSCPGFTFHGRCKHLVKA